MKKRSSLAGNVSKPALDAAEKAAEVTRKLSGGKAQASAPDDEPLMLTSSYVLPADMVDELAELAALRLQRDKAEKRAHRRAIAAAKKAGTAPPVEAPSQARRSASAIVREAIEAYRPTLRAEIEALEKELKDR